MSTDSNDLRMLMLRPEARHLVDCGGNGCGGDLAYVEGAEEAGGAANQQVQIPGAG
jgi:hypothetical protein